MPRDLVRGSGPAPGGTLRSVLRRVPPSRDAFSAAVLAGIAGITFLTVSAGYLGLRATGALDPHPVSLIHDPRQLRQYNQQPIRSALWEPETGRLWIGTDGGLESFEPRTRLWRTALPTGTRYGRCPVRWVARSDSVLFAGDGTGGVWRRGPNSTLVPLFGSGGVPDLDLTAAVTTAAGPDEILLSLGRALAVYHRHHRSWSRFTLHPERREWERRDDPGAGTLDSVSIRALAYVPEEETFYVGTDLGLYARRAGAWLPAGAPADDPLGPVLQLRSHGGRIWVLSEARQGSLRLGRFEGNRYMDFLRPSPLAADPEHFTGIADLDDSLFLGTRNQFLRVFSAQDHSWEVIRQSETGTASRVDQLEVFDRRLWLATERGLLVFHRPEKLWEIGRSARIPVFSVAHGSAADLGGTDPSPRDSAIHRIRKTPGALYVIPQSRALGRILPGTQTIDWLISPSAASLQVARLPREVSYRVTDTDLLSARDVPGGLLLGTRRGALRYDSLTHRWDEFQPERFHEKAVYWLEPARVPGEVLAATSEGFQDATGRTLAHPGNDRIVRLDPAPRGALYRTAKGELGYYAQGAAEFQPLVIPGQCPVPPDSFTSVARWGNRICFGTANSGIAVYDAEKRRWDGAWVSGADMDSSRTSLLDDRIWEVRASSRLLAYRTSRGDVGALTAEGSRSLVGRPGPPGLGDGTGTAAAADGSRIWCASVGSVVPYDTVQHAWGDPIPIADDSPVVDIGLHRSLPVALTRGGSLYLQKRRLADEVTKMAAGDQVIAYMSRGRTRLIGPEGSGYQTPADGIPDGDPLIDVSETDAALFVACPERLWRYDKKARFWGNWGCPSGGTIRKVATRHDGTVGVLLSSGSISRCAAANVWQPEPIPGDRARDLVSWAGDAFILTDSGRLLKMGEPTRPPDQRMSPAPLIDVRPTPWGVAFAQSDGIQLYDPESGRWGASLPAPPGQSIRHVSGQQSFLAVTADRQVLTARFGARDGLPRLHPLFTSHAPVPAPPLDALIDVARIGQRIYFAEPHRLNAYDVVLRQWLPPLELPDHTLTAFLCSERYLALVTRSGAVLLSSELFAGTLPHQNLETDWTPVPGVHAADARALAMTTRGHILVLERDGQVSLCDPFSRSRSVLASVGQLLPMGAQGVLIRTETIYGLAAEQDDFWLATDQGLLRYSMDRGRLAFVERQLPGRPVTRIFLRPGFRAAAETAEGQTYVRNAEGQWQREERPPDAPAQGVALRENGLWRWVRHPAGWSVQPSRPNLPLLDAERHFFFDDVQAVHAFNDTIWMATESAVCAFTVTPDIPGLDPETMTIHPVRGVTRFESTRHTLYAVAADGQETFRWDGDRWATVPSLPPPTTEVLIASPFWRWERQGDGISGTLISPAGKEVPIDLNWARAHGRLPADNIHAAAVSLKTDTLWLSTSAGLIRRIPRGTQYVSPQAPESLIIARDRNGTDALCGRLEGRWARFNEAVEQWEFQGAAGDPPPGQDIRTENAFWLWHKDGDAVVGRFQQAPSTPVWVSRNGQRTFSFDDVHDVRAFAGRVWLATSAGPLAIDAAPRPFSPAHLRIPQTGPVIELNVASAAPGQPPRLWARSPDHATPPWQYHPDQDSWSANADEKPFDREVLVANDRWFIERDRPEAPSTRRVYPQILGASGRWIPAALSRSRWAFDDVLSMLVHEDDLWLLTPGGLAWWHRRPAGASEAWSFACFPLPAPLTVARARITAAAGTVHLTFPPDSPGGQPKLVTLDRRDGTWAEVTPTAAQGGADDGEVLRGACWSWREKTPSPGGQPSLEGSLLFTDGTSRPLHMPDKAFPFDRFAAASADAENVWLSTDAGVARCRFNGHQIPLDGMRLYPAGGHGETFVRLGANPWGLSEGLYLTGTAEAASRYDPVADRWETFPKPPPALHPVGDRELLIPFNGLWRWSRSRDFDAPATRDKPVVQVQTIDRHGEWRNIPFAEGRFGFDCVSDVLISGGKTWLTTRAGLCVFPGEASTFDLSQMNLHADLAEASDLTHGSDGDVCIRLQNLVNATYAVSPLDPQSTPRSLPRTNNPFQDQVLVERAQMRWVRHETYEGNSVRGAKVQLRVRDANGAWQDVPLTPGRLPIDDTNDFLIHGSGIWLATPAGVVMVPLQNPADTARLRFFPETGQVSRLLARDTQGASPALLCLAPGPRGDVALRYQELTEGGRNWHPLDSPALFRSRQLIDGPWHWFQERKGVSVLWRGLPDMPRPMLAGRFADEVALAVTADRQTLFALTPAGLAAFQWDRSDGAIELLHISAIRPVRTSPDGEFPPASLASADGRLWLAMGDRLRLYRITDPLNDLTFQSEWPIVPQDAAPPSRLAFRLTDSGLFLNVLGGVTVDGAGATTSGYDLEYRVDEGGIEAQTTRTGPRCRYAWNADRGELVVWPQSSRDAEGPRSPAGPDGSAEAYAVPCEFPSLGILAGRDRIWLAYPDRVEQVFPSALLRRSAKR